jgi:hypothetical protein
MPSRTAAKSQMRWNSVYDRAAACFGAERAPLVGKIMRYYIRSSQVRYSYPIMVLSLLLAVVDGQRCFFMALGLISIVGAMCMGAMIENVFGFDGAGFRRYYLLPIPLAKVFRTTALVSLILGGMAVLFALAIWVAFVFPLIPIGGTMIVMLVSCGFAGLFLFQAFGIWTSLLAPRAIEFKAILGNKLSIWANLLTIVCVLFGYLILPKVLENVGMEPLLEHWWVVPLILFATMIFYIATLFVGAVVFSSRREIILSTIERGC